MTTTAQPVSRRPTLNRIVRSAAIVMFFSLTTKLISLVQQFVIVQRFGVGAEYDTYVAANAIPEQVFNLIAGGALSFAFIPIFTGLLEKDQRDQAWRLASNILNTVFSLALLLSAVIFIFAPTLAVNIAPGFTAERQAQTAEMMRILLLSLMIFSVSGLCTGILQSHQHFLLPAIAPVMFDIGLLFGVIFLVPPFGVYGLAYGTVIGAAGHLLIQVPGLIAHRARWLPLLNPRDPDLQTVVILMIPRVVGLGLALFNLNIVTVNRASQLGEGAASAFSWGWRIMQLPETLIGTALGIVMFPVLARLSASGDVEGKRNAMSGALRFILFATIPSALMLILIGRPAIGLLRGGALDESGVELIYQVLVALSLGVVTHGCLEIVARSFYADKDTLTPLYAAFLAAILNVILALSLSQPTVLGVAGLGLANSVAVGVEVIVLLIVLRRRWNGINHEVLLTTTLKTVIASGVMIVGVLVAGGLFNSLLRGGRFSEVIYVGLLAGVGGISFLVTAYLIRTQEVVMMLDALISRVRGKPAAV
jgi:putative peptidoglycan lipid II flippase